jgi:ABC-type Fe3+/spermidine/putrescine transport system ATPase subunit
VVDPDHASLLELRNLSFRYSGRSFAFEDVNLKIPLGTQFCLVGPNGCGKTTLLRLIGGHLVPNHGRILYREDDVSLVPPVRRPFATVFQDHALFPHLSVLDNVAYGLRHRNHIKLKAAREIASEWIERLALTRLSSSRPPTLSLGSQQRVAIARALAVCPEVLLMDEPSASLDTPQKRDLMVLLAQAHDKGWVETIILVSHDLEFALSLCDQVAIIDSGKILASGDVEKLVAEPPDEIVARYLDASNILVGDIDKSGNFCSSDGSVEISIRTEVRQAIGRVGLLIRPDGITATAHSVNINATHGTVEVVLRKYPPELLIRVGDGVVLRGQVDQSNGAIERGSEVELGIDPSRLMFVPLHTQNHDNKKGPDQLQ